MLELSPDDWAMEPKIDGCRVVVCHAGVHTRHGSLLTKPKGLDALKAVMGAEFFQPQPVILEGEWVQKTGQLWLFDLPACPGPYDERTAMLDYIVDKLGPDV